MKSIYGIAVFHNIGDILLCTPIARQLKADHPDCEVVWFTSEKYQYILENNPFIDRVISFEGNPLTLDACIPQLKSTYSWTRFFTPAAYMNRDKTPGGSLSELVKGSVDFAWTVPFVPVVRLSETEKVQAAAYWNALPSGKKILIETEFGSQQTPLNQQFLDRLFEVLSPIRPVFIFTAKNKPAWLDDYQANYPNVIWCREPFRLNAEFYNCCDAFVGVSSGISCLSNSDTCRNDVPHLEISRGYHWSNASYPSRKKELYVSYTLGRFEEGLHWLFDKLTDSNRKHCFNGRFTSDSFLYANHELIPCTMCGSFDFVVVRRRSIVKCRECGNVYLRDRMNPSEMERFYSEVYAVNDSNAASPFRVPRSREEIDIHADCIGAQRRGVLAEIQSLLGIDLKGKTLIDIGCGWGAFLYHARNQGMNVMGFEFTRPNVQFGRDVLKLDIRQQQFIEAEDIAENSVDIVVMNHALEHVPYPFEFLEKIEYVLKPGGIFFCMVPNFESLCSDVLREKWPWVEQNWHYTHFTPTTLKDALAQTGFFIENSYTTSGDFGDNFPTEILKKLKPGLSETDYQQQLRGFQRQGKGEQINVLAVKRGGSKGRIKLADQTLTAVRSGEVRKVLIVRSDNIGDFVIFGGAIQYFKKLYPQAAITLVVTDSVADIAVQCPYVDFVITFNRAKMEEDAKYLAGFMKEIRQAQYDVAITPVLSRDQISDFIVINSRATERIASFGDGANLTLEQLRENDQHFTRIIPVAEGIRLETERNEEFLKGLGVKLDSPYEPTVWLTPEDVVFADTLLNQLRLDKPVVIAPFAQNRKRNWPVINWAKLISLHPHQSVVICGVAGDKAEADRIVRLSGHSNIHNLCGRTTIRQMAAIISKSRVCVSCESAAAHIAAAIGVPQVVLLGGGHFGRFMPYAESTHPVYTKMDCFNCNWKCKHDQDIRCIYYIGVEAVENQLCQILGDAGPAGYRVSAIVSTYNSEQFIRGCLQDLVEQTLYQQGKLEIVIINSGSQQNEEAIVKEYQSRYPHIQYIKTERETLYAAWNRGVLASHGAYITNANTDDRHAPDMLEKLANCLDLNPQAAAVYSHFYITQFPNQTWRTKTPEKLNKWHPPYSRQKLLKGNFMGPFPMWRKDVHGEYGYFDELMKVAGDYEFFLRVSQTRPFVLVPEPLGLYYYNPNSLERSAGTRDAEDVWIKALYQNTTRIVRKPFDPSKDAVFTMTKEVSSQVLPTPVTRECWSVNTSGNIGASFANSQNNKFLDDTTRVCEKQNASIIKKQPQPLVSIYMGAYNAQAYIRQAVESVLSQTFREFELIVVDDGSTDRTVDVVESFKDSRIRLLRQEHQNFAAAMNTAISHARGEWIIGVDSDDDIEPDYLERMVNFAIANPGFDYYYPASLFLNDPQKQYSQDRWDYQNFEDNQILPSFLLMNGFSPIPNAGSLKRKTMFATTGLYRQMDAVEDFDFLARNAMKIRFKRADGIAGYHYRINPAGNCHRFVRRCQVTAQILDEMIHIYSAEVLCPPLDKILPIDKDQKYRQFILNVFQGLANRYSGRGGEFFANAAVKYRTQSSKNQVQQACI